MPRIEAGRIYPFEGPGLGLALSEAVLGDKTAVRRLTKLGDF